MSEWKDLPDRTTSDGQTLRTQTSVIDDETWYRGNIPEPQYVTRRDPRFLWLRKRKVRR